GGERGGQQMSPDGSRDLVLQTGYRYDGRPGSADFRTIQYDTYGVLLPKPEVVTEVTDREAMASTDLLGSPDLRNRAELQWRLAIPLLVPILAFFAVPLARDNPYQMRLLLHLPALNSYMVDLAMC